MKRLVQGKYSNLEINNININPQYSLNGKQRKIVVSKESNLNVDIHVVNRVRNLCNLPEIVSIEAYFQSLFKPLNIDKRVFNYSLILNPKMKKEYSGYLIDNIKASLPLFTTYFTEIFGIRKSIYENLNTVILDNKILEVPRYRHNSVTGRTGIISGHNFLSMKKEDKKKLKYYKDGYVLLEIDFKSCEPNFFLKSRGIELNSEDLYLGLTEKFNIGVTDRSVIKKGILAMIYGANESTISKIMKTKKSNVAKIKKSLEIYDFEKCLNEEFENKKLIYNFLICFA